MSILMTLPIFHGHNDTLQNFYRPAHTGVGAFFERGDQGHLDLPRARNGGLGDAAGFPHLIQALRDRGYDDKSLRKLSSQNWLRVLRATWRA